MKKEIILSVIVPVYNVERYIEKCLLSIIEQMTKEVELIIVDDCTPDKSITICERLINDFDELSIKLIRHTSNCKISKARNTGIEVASGKYCWFVDSDDYIAEGAIQKILYKIKKCPSDMYFFNHNTIEKDQRDIGGVVLKSNAKIINNDKMRNRFIYQLVRNEFGYEVWKKVFSLELIRKHAIKFVEDVSYGEDMGFIIECAFYCNSVNIGEEYIYNYVQHTNSMMGKSKTVSKMKEIEEIATHLCKIASNKNIVRDEFLIYAGIFRVAISQSWNLNLYNCIENIKNDEYSRSMMMEVIKHPIKLVKAYGKKVGLSIFINSIVCKCVWSNYPRAYRICRKLKEIIK